MNNFEIKCPFCKNEYCGTDISVPGIYRAITYDDSAACIAYYPEPPKLLYHYTTLDTLKSILDAPNAILRATHYSQMNDWKEIEIGYNILRKAFYEQVPFENEKIIFDALEDIKNKLKNCYLISFSEKPDTLSQWRAYTSPSNGGVCIGFNSECLQTDHETFYLSPCSYTRYVDNDLQINYGKIVDVAKYRVSNEGQINIKNQEKEDEKTLRILQAYGGTLTIENYLDDLETFITTVKHNGFYEEQEWRLIALRPNNKKYPEYLSEKNKRFIEFSFDPSNAICKIIISPHGDKNMIRNVIEFYKNNGILSKDCEIIDSKIPYRG